MVPEVSGVLRAFRACGINVPIVLKVPLVLQVLTEKSMEPKVFTVIEVPVMFMVRMVP